MNIIGLLTEIRDQTLNYFNLPSENLSLIHAPDKWNVKQILVHLADAEGVLQERIKRVIAEPKGVIWAFDQDLWCQNIDYEHVPLEVSKALYMSNRASIIYLAGKYYELLGTREFIHSQTGIRTLKQEFDKVISHNQGHINQIERALAASGHFFNIARANR